jgi:hypothetical protein
LSPVAIAANFVAASERVERLALANRQLLQAILEFADAWHWLHFEAIEHPPAAKSYEGRLKGPAAKRANAEHKRAVIRSMFEKEQRQSPKAMAGEMLPLVNKALKNMGMRPIAEKSLTDELRALLKRSGPTD